jgi:hypothetical protein
MTQTTIESDLLIRPVARFVAIGLFLVAFFTRPSTSILRAGL